MTLKNFMLAGAACIALTGMGAASETPPGFYLDLAGGANFPTDFDTDRSIDNDTGYLVKGSAGFKLDNNLRVEFEMGYRDGDYTRSLNRTGHISVFSQMANVLYDFDVAPHFVISVGGGVGGARIGIEDDNTLSSGIDARDYVFAWQGIAEAEYMATDHLGIYGGYNYFSADNFDVSATRAPTTAVFKDDYYTHSVYLGVRYHFFEPASAPPPPPPAPPPVAAKTFIVFFGFDKSDLTPEARAVVAEAAAAYKSTGAVSIAIVGHTDTVGSAAYNQPLSERRAASVKSGLVANGVAGTAVSTTGKGFSEPLVPTGPGVKEPQNRRATIDLSGSGT